MSRPQFPSGEKVPGPPLQEAGPGGQEGQGSRPSRRPYNPAASVAPEETFGFRNINTSNHRLSPQNLKINDFSTLRKTQEAQANVRNTPVITLQPTLCEQL